MTEQEYIAATNLTKAYLALHAVREILPDGEIITDEAQIAVADVLRKWWYELSVKTTTAQRGEG